jgi:hypothetical protein
MTKNLNVLIILIIWIHFPIWSNAQLNEIKYSKTFDLPKDAKIEQNALYYYQLGHYEKAQINFFKTIEKQNFEKISYLYFANSLSASGKNALALEFHHEYLKSLSGREYKRVNNLLGQLNEFKDKDMSNESQGQLNGGSFTTFFDNKLFIAQSGQIHSFLITADNNLAYYQREFEEFKNYNLSSVAFLNNGLMVIIGVLDEGNKKSSLYYSVLKKNKWSKLKPISSIDKNLNAAFPANNPKGNELFFSLETKDGNGGFDLYVCTFENGNWTKPLNLGNNINTLGNEIMPFIQEEKLYFSSNGNPSFGGYDIFSVSLNNLNENIINEVQWNTNQDDLSLLKLPKENFLYTSFNETVYVVDMLRVAAKTSLTTNIPSASYSLKVMDESNNPISDAFVIFDFLSSKGSFFKVDNNGSLELPNNYSSKKLPIKVISDGYTSVVIDWNINEPIIVKLMKRTGEIVNAGSAIANVPKTEKTKTIVYEESSSSYERVISRTRIPQATPEEKKKEYFESKSELSEKTTSDKKKEIPDDALSVEPVKNTSHHIQNSKQNGTHISIPDRGLFYVIVGSTPDPIEAVSLWNSFSSKFDNLEILKYGPNLYRIGFYAGGSNHDATQNLKTARAIKSDAWLIRPTN